MSYSFFWPLFLPSKEHEAQKQEKPNKKRSLGSIINLDKEKNKNEKSRRHSDAEFFLIGVFIQLSKEPKEKSPLLVYLFPYFLALASSKNIT